MICVFENTLPLALSTSPVAAAWIRSRVAGPEITLPSISVRSIVPLCAPESIVMPLPPVPVTVVALVSRGVIVFPMICVPVKCEAVLPMPSSIGISFPVNVLSEIATSFIVSSLLSASTPQASLLK